MKHLRLFEDFNQKEFEEKQKQKAFRDFQTIQSMFKTTRRFSMGHNINNASVNIDEFLSNPKSQFAMNEFEKNGEFDRPRFKKLIDTLKDMGAANIRVTGMPVGYGWSTQEIIDEPQADTLVFNAPDDVYDEMVKIAKPNDYQNFQSDEDNPNRGDYDGMIRFWWD
ncbi:MAG: hypothetical protein SLAVMIC_00482 [uncultured marine phage]|uniref:Uncharacterized protein n=1 Tax=uncultured marine phage TaxID=707152 RepID=A0A8D9CC63_9VIRU|nr:MAG: hypothetical protein SLAVMIC_00482 [uncultured marine phage]